MSIEKSAQKQDPEKTTLNTKAGSKRMLPVALGIILILGLGLVLLRGKIANRIRSVSNLARAISDSRSVSGRGDFTNIIFVHHSTGANLIRQGGVRERFSEAGFQFWDHDYNARGLTRPDGTSAGYHYNIPNDNTDPDGYARIFSQRLYGWPLNAFSGLMQHEVIVFKSCFPVSHIASDSQLEQYKAHYRQMRAVMDRHPDHVFVVVTPPPLDPVHTDMEIAGRARIFANWLKSDEFLGGHPNIFTFDLFDLLAEGVPAAPDHNMLREEYQREGEDPHPNQAANETIGPLFVDFVIDAIQTYQAR